MTDSGGHFYLAHTTVFISVEYSSRVVVRSSQIKKIDPTDTAVRRGGSSSDGALHTLVRGLSALDVVVLTSRQERRICHPGLTGHPDLLCSAGFIP